MNTKKLFIQISTLRRRAENDSFCKEFLDELILPQQPLTFLFEMLVLPKYCVTHYYY